MIAALSLAAALAFPQGAETIRIAADQWPERQAVEKIEPGERAWWWSKDCAPHLLTAQDANISCAPQKAFRVHVHDRASGKSIAGARVIWATDAMLVSLPDAMLPSTTTDAAGNAELRVPANGALRVRIDGPRVASWWQNADGASLQIAAVPASPSVLQVTPGARAVVELELAMSDVRSRAIARDGRVQLPNLPPVPMTLAGWSENAAPLVMEVDAAQMPRMLELPPGSSIEGRIVDSRRKPIEGASIEALFAIGKLARGLRRSVQSTRNGAFVLRGIPIGPTQLKVSKPELATIVRGLQAEADLDLGNLTLRSARRAVVRVVDGDGEPIANATVRIADGASTKTARDGTARIEGVPVDDDVAIHVAAPGFRAADENLAADAKSPLIIELARGVRVIGKIVDAQSGRSAGPGDVLVINNGAQRVVPFDDTGVIDIGGLDDGTLALEVRAASLAPRPIAPRNVIADETWDLGTLHLDAGNFIAGRVIDEDGAALPGARVRVLRQHARGPEVAAVMNDWIATSSGDDGAFRVTGLAAGSQMLLVDAAGFAPRMMTVDVNDAANDDPVADPIEVQLDRARGLVIECTPVTRCGAEARLLYAGALHPWATTSATMQDGIARIATAARGEALLRLVQNGSVIHERTVQIGATPETRVQISLAPATLRGTVMTAGRARRDGGTVDLRANLSPSAGLPVFLERRTEDGLVLGSSWAGDIPTMRSTAVDAAGRFVFEELEPGSYELTYRLDGRPAKSQSIVVSPGTSQVTLDVPPGELHGRVLQEDGSAAGFMTVRVVDAAGVELHVLADQFGRFDAIGVSAGRAVVTASSEFGTASRAIDVDATQSAVVDLVLRRGVTP